MELPLLYT